MRIFYRKGFAGFWTVFILLYHAGLHSTLGAIQLAPACPAKSNHKCLCVENKCYIFVKGLLTWADGQSTCTAFGGNLLRLASEPERLFLRRNIAQDISNWVEFWVGGRKVAHQWRWAYKSEPLASAYVGCYETMNAFYYTDSPIYLTSNNPNLCVSMCQQYSAQYLTYRYAALSENECTCMTDLTQYRGLTDSYCRIVCPGDATTFCGGYGSVSVYDITKSSYMLWSETPTLYPADHDCVFLEKPVVEGLEVRWQTSGCTARHRFVCEYPSRIQNGPRSLNVSAELRTWYEARLACQQNGGYLSEPKTTQDYTYLMSMINDFSPYWLGLSRSSIGWTADGSANAATNAQCLSFRDKAVYAWKQCSAALQFICQISGDIINKQLVVKTIKSPNSTPSLPKSLISRLLAPAVIPPELPGLPIQDPFAVNPFKPPPGAVPQYGGLNISQPGFWTNFPGGQIGVPPTPVPAPVVPAPVVQPNMPRMNFAPNNPIPMNPILPIPQPRNPVIRPILPPFTGQLNYRQPTRFNPSKPFSRNNVPTLPNKLAATVNSPSANTRIQPKPSFRTLNMPVNKPRVQPSKTALSYILPKNKQFTTPSPHSLSTEPTLENVNAIISQIRSIMSQLETTTIPGNLVNIPAVPVMLPGFGDFNVDSLTTTDRARGNQVISASATNNFPVRPQNNRVSSFGISDNFNTSKGLDVASLIPQSLRDEILAAMMNQTHRGMQPTIPPYLRARVLKAIRTYTREQSSNRPSNIPVQSLNQPVNFLDHPTPPKYEFQPGSSPGIRRGGSGSGGRVGETQGATGLPHITSTVPLTTTTCPPTERTDIPPEFIDDPWKGPLPIFLGVGIGIPVLFIIAIVVMVVTKAQCVDFRRVFQRKNKCRMDYWADNISQPVSLAGSLCDYGPFRSPVIYNPDFVRRKAEANNVHGLSICAIQNNPIPVDHVVPTTEMDAAFYDPRYITGDYPRYIKGQDSAMTDVGIPHRNAPVPPPVVPHKTRAPVIPPRIPAGDTRRNSRRARQKPPKPPKPDPRRPIMQPPRVIGNQARHDPIGESSTDDPIGDRVQPPPPENNSISIRPTSLGHKILDQLARSGLITQDAKNNISHLADAMNGSQQDSVGRGAGVDVSKSRVFIRMSGSTDCDSLQREPPDCYRLNRSRPPPPVVKSKRSAEYSEMHI